jgi:predicted Zn-dependent peptidase
MYRKRLVFSALAVFFFASTFVWAAPPKGSKGLVTKALEGQVVEFQLKNGMKWLLVPRKDSAPVFFGIVMIKTGGVDEAIGKTGVAHILEHLAFKGTKDISPKELWDAFVTNGGADLNAYTTKDVTAYHASMPTAKLPLWMYLTSEMLQNSQLTEFDKEKEVVLEELVGKEENTPERKMVQVLLDTAFDTSPYKWPTIGRKADVENMTREDVANFRKKYYSPERMVGSLSGNFDVETAKALIQEYFGDFQPAATRQTRPPKEAAQDGTRRAEVVFNASPNIFIAYHKPTLPEFDDFAFDLISEILCGGNDSVLRRELVYKRRLVSDVGCEPSFPGARFNNLFLIYAEPLKSSDYKKVEATIDVELIRLAKDGPSAEALERARNSIIKTTVFDLAENDGMAQSLAYMQSVAGGWRYIIQQLKTYDAITPEDIASVAGKYFTDNNKTVVTLVKK